MLKKVKHIKIMVISISQYIDIGIEYIVSHHYNKLLSANVEDAVSKNEDNVNIAFLACKSTNILLLRIIYCINLL